jgi:intergrase/recombinase
LENKNVHHVVNIAKAFIKIKATFIGFIKGLKQEETSAKQHYLILFQLNKIHIKRYGHQTNF